MVTVYMYNLYRKSIWSLVLSFTVCREFRKSLWILVIFKWKWKNEQVEFKYENLMCSIKNVWKICLKEQKERRKLLEKYRASYIKLDYLQALILKLLTLYGILNEPCIFFIQIFIDSAPHTHVWIYSHLPKSLLRCMI